MSITPNNMFIIVLDRDPTSTEDFQHPYMPVVGWFWLNSSSGDIFVLLDATPGAYVWVKKF